MNIEVLPKENLSENKEIEIDESEDMEPENLPQFKRSAPPLNNFPRKVRTHKWIVMSVGIIILIILGTFITQIFTPKESPQIVKVTNFQECVENGGKILADTNPRECYFRQVKFADEASIIQPLQSTPKPNEEPKITNQKYTHISFPKLEITYYSDWKKTEENTDTGTTFLLQKNGITLSYSITLVEIFSDQGGQCTDNTALFLDIANSGWFRVRTNSGERYYTTRLNLKNQGVPSDDTNDIINSNQIKLEWVEISPIPSGIYEACVIGTSNIAGLTDSNIPSNLQTTTGNKFGILTIRVSGISDNNMKTLEEVDKIVASTVL